MTDEFGETVELGAISSNEFTICGDDTESADMHADMYGVIVPSELVPYAYATKMTVYPVAVCPELGTIVYNSGVSRTINFSTYYQHAKYALSPTSTTQLMNQLLAILDSEEEEYLIAGWFIEVTFYFQSSNPREIVITPTSTSVSGEAIKLTLTGTSGGYIIRDIFGYPDGKNPWTDRYSVGFNGTFSYYYNGNYSTMPFSAVVTLNAQTTSA